MINLLPPKQKQRLLKQERLRVILILGILFVSFLFSLFLVLFWIKNYIATDFQTQKIFLEEKKKLVSANPELQKEITEFNALFTDLASFYQKNINPVRVLENISSKMPSGTYLREFNFAVTERKGKEETRISISGYCPNRNALIELKDNLEKEKEFSEIYFSPGSWIKPTDINFTVNFKLNTEI